MTTTDTTTSALVLRTCRADMTSRAGFVWPVEGPVTAPDWRPDAKSGNGLHGALWGEGDGVLFNWKPDAVWQVVRITEWVDLVGKVKFPSGVVVHTGDQKSATDYIIAHGATGPVIGATVVAGDYGSARAGDYGSARAGDRGSALAGKGGSALAGDYGSALAGDYGSALAGDRGSAQAGKGGSALAGYHGSVRAGDYGSAQAGYHGSAQAGDGGSISIRWHDGTRYRLAVGYVGEDGIMPNTMYHVVGGKLVQKGATT